MTAEAVIGVDVGGTFTDTVIVGDDGTVTASKALTTRGDLVEGVLASLANGAAILGCTLSELLGATRWISHGTTVGLNALLTRTGASVGLLTTAGFEGVVPVARLNYIRGIRPEDRTQMRSWEKPDLLVERSRIVGLRERIDVRGVVLAPLDESHARLLIRRLAASGVDAVAVCLLWSIKNPVHEHRVREIVREEMPGAFVTVSSDLSSRIGEYERAMASLLNSYVGPLFDHYLGALEATLRDDGFAGTLYGMQMDGGVRPARYLRSNPLSAIKSGPVGGLFAVQRIGQFLGHQNIVATDVGGTSFDVGLVVDGAVPMAAQPRIERYEISTPVADVVSIGTGGGSIARLDRALGRLLVGPQSVGASPGPVCYGLGGTEPTVTDAAAVLGYMARAGSELTLDTVAARAAIREQIAEPLGLGVEEAADGILRVASAQMADLVRRVTILRGHDLREFRLYAYGGAAPQYAGRYGAELGAREVVIPRLAAVLSAFGIAISDLQGVATRDLAPSLLRDSVEMLDEVLKELEAGVRSELRSAVTDVGPEPRLERRAGLRFTRQVEKIDVLLPPGPITATSLEHAEKEFRAEYERLVGRGTTLSGTPLEVVSLSVRLRIPLRGDAETTAGGIEPPSGRGEQRRVWFDGRWRDCPVTGLGALGAGIDGPALVELSTTTVVVYPGQRAEVDAAGDVVLYLSGEAVGGR